MEKEKSNIEYWEEVIKDEPESYKKWHKEETEFLRERVKEEERILEVGCGNGRSLKEILNKKPSIFGIDHDKKAIEDAKENFKDYPNSNFEVAKAEKMPFENNYFDVITIMGTFANFGKKKQEILEEIKRVLKENGKIIISVFSENAFEERMEVYKRAGVKIKEIKGTTVTFEFDNSLGDDSSEQFSEKELREIFEKANLKVKEIKKINIAYLCELTKWQKQS